MYTYYAQFKLHVIKVTTLWRLVATLPVFVYSRRIAASGPFSHALLRGTNLPCTRWQGIFNPSVTPKRAPDVCVGGNPMQCSAAAAVSLCMRALCLENVKCSDDRKLKQEPSCRNGKPTVWWHTGDITEDRFCFRIASEVQNCGVPCVPPYDRIFQSLQNQDVFG